MVFGFIPECRSASFGNSVRLRRNPHPDVDAAKAVADYLRMNARLGELIQVANGLDLARAKTPFGPKWVKIPLGARLGT